MLNLELLTFRAIDAPETCMQFTKRHHAVLREFGVTLLNENEDWIENPNIYVVSLVNKEDKTILGGCKLQMYDGVNPLPLEAVAKKYDPGILKYCEMGVGEACSLFLDPVIRSKEHIDLIANKIIEVGRSISIQKILALFSPKSITMGYRMGFEKMKHIGEQGVLPYPDPTLCSHFMIFTYLPELPPARQEKGEDQVNTEQETEN